MNQSWKSYNIRCLKKGRCPACGVKVFTIDTYCPKHRRNLGGANKGYQFDLCRLLSMGLGFRLTRGYNMLNDEDEG